MIFISPDSYENMKQSESYLCFYSKFFNYL